VAWFLDETGDYPDAVMATCENIFSGEPIEAHIVQAGNPTKRSGPLFRAVKSIARDLWKLIEITADPDSPKRTPRVSIEHARDQIKQYGRDNPWVLVNIFGEFPPSDINALIGEQEVEDSFNRMYREWDYRGAPKILGVDVAREGNDASVIVPRQGLQCFPIQKYRNIDSLQGAGQVVRKWNEWQADACFVDATGGYGWGWIDQLRQLGKSPIPVQFAGEAHNKDRYYNKRTEMYFDTIEWIRRGGAMIRSTELMLALTQTTYTFKGDRLLLEEKAMIKERLGFSPDEADGLVETFAEPIAPKGGVALLRPVIHQPTYDPFAEFDRMAKGAADSGGYDPFKA
jgi:phage terminase large subunit